MNEHDIGFLRQRLNRLIETEAGFDEIYEVSLQLDELIVQYYEKE